jgi:hypothetical protein
MIQRKQTLFLFLSAFISIALLFMSNASLSTINGNVDLFLVPLTDPGIPSTMGHSAAIIINFLVLFISCINVFLYRKRELQTRLCFVLLALWLVLALMLSLCPFVELSATVTAVHRNFLATVLAVAGMAASFLAARFIKKDIELLKSADRIR